MAEEERAPEGWNRAVIEEFRANGGRVGGRFEGTSLVLLTTVGARSGRAHTTPVASLRDGGRILVFASNAGAPHHPAWFHNLIANPQVTVEDGAATRSATAVVLEGDERDRLYARQAAHNPAFAAYQDRIERAIPVVALYPLDTDRAQAIGDHLVQVHRELRDQLTRLREELEMLLSGRTPAPASLTRDLREHCLTACTALHEHHENEDGRGFPLLVANYPGIAPMIERLRAEHVKVAALTDAIEASVAALDPATVRGDLDRLIGELEAHFAEEERLLVAALNAVKR